MSSGESQPKTLFTLFMQIGPCHTGVEFLTVLCCLVSNIQILPDSDPNCLTTLILFLMLFILCHHFFSRFSYKFRKQDIEIKRTQYKPQDPHIFKHEGLEHFNRLSRSILLCSITESHARQLN